MNFAEEIEYAYFLYLNNWGKEEMYNCGQKSLSLDNVSDVIINFSLIDENESGYVDAFQQFALEFNVKLPTLNEARLWNINKKHFFSKKYPNKFLYSIEVQMLDQIFILSTYLRKIENKETKLIADILEKLSNNINILGMDLIRSLQGIVRGSSESTEARSILNLIMKFLNSLKTSQHT